MSEVELDAEIRSLPDALQHLSREMKVALVKNGYVALMNFPGPQYENGWNDLKTECGFSSAQRNEVMNALFPHQPQGT
jgi:hypothetical protein